MMPQKIASGKEEAMALLKANALLGAWNYKVKASVDFKEVWKALAVVLHTEASTNL